jgi:hypothetical protein
MKKLSMYLPSDVLKTLYYSLVYPYLFYGVVVWGGSCRTGLTRLQRLQDRIVRLLSPGPQIYFGNKLLTLPEIFASAVLQFFLPYYCLGLSDFFLRKITDIQVVHSHSTRFKTNFNLNMPRVPTTIFRCSFYYQCINQWNKLPNEIKDIPSLFKFKRVVKEFLLSQ